MGCCQSKKNIPLPGTAQIIDKKYKDICSDGYGIKIGMAESIYIKNDKHRWPDIT